MIPKRFDATNGERVSGLELESRGNWGHLGIPPQFGLVEGIRLSDVIFSKI